MAEYMTGQQGFVQAEGITWVPTYKDFLGGDFVAIFGSVISEVWAPGQWLVNAKEEPNDAANVRVSVLGEAELSSHVFVVLIARL